MKICDKCGKKAVASGNLLPAREYVSRFDLCKVCAEELKVWLSMKKEVVTA